MITYKTFLMYENNDKMESLCPIKSFPDIGSEPETLEKTSLIDSVKVYEEGLQDTGSMTFVANYDEKGASYTKIANLKGKKMKFALWLGGTEAADGTLIPTGEHGRWTWTGTVSPSFIGKGANEIVEFNINCMASTEPVFSVPTEDEMTA